MIWSYSFLWNKALIQIQTISNNLLRISLFSKALDRNKFYFPIIFARESFKSSQARVSTRAGSWEFLRFAMQMSLQSKSDNSKISIKKVRKSMRLSRGAKIFDTVGIRNDVIDIRTMYLSYCVSDIYTWAWHLLMNIYDFLANI